MDNQRKRTIMNDENVIETENDTKIVEEYIDTTDMQQYIDSFITHLGIANQMYQICLDNNLDYDKVTELALFDDRIGKSHLAVPGPDGDLGFGGHCFPKDLAAMIAFGSINNGDTEFLQTVQDFNYKVRKIRDWEQMKGRAVSDD